MEFRISKTNWKYEFLVALHELVEWALIHDKGLAIEDIDAFDIQFEKERSEGKHSKDAEPGNDMTAPYYMEHQIATSIEQAMAVFLKVDWPTYEKTIEDL